MKMTFSCEICQQEVPLSQKALFLGQEVCKRCLDTHTAICVYCGQRVWNENIHYDEGRPVCPECFEAHFVSCADCGRPIHEHEARYLEDGDDDPYCERCYAQRQSSETIHDYSYRPWPLFYGTGPRYFGVELEIDGAGEDRYNAAKILEFAQTDEQERLYVKHDGSLDDGFELVSHPMSLDYHLTDMPWEDILREAARLGYRSHQTSTCGLHIHVSRNAFGHTEQEQDAAIARILFFVEKNWEELLKFSRRTPRQLERWAGRYGYKEKPKEILDHAKKGAHGGRYTCVNLTNEDTIEFRMFRGTLKLNTLIATLQLVDRVCDVALFLSDEELKALSWTTFASSCTQPELVKYLKERRLYVNEPVDVEEDL